MVITTKYDNKEIDESQIKDIRRESIILSDIELVEKDGNVRILVVSWFKKIIQIVLKNGELVKAILLD